jgi:DNA-binding response OmpR family regulator
LALQEEAESIETGGSETILIVEDSEPVRTLVARILENAGYQVLIAESATAALRHCSRHPDPIDLLLTDVVLPKASGPDIARRALELRPGIRTLYMSGFTDDTLIRHGLRPGQQPLLEKPFSPATVLSRVRQMLDVEPDDTGSETFPVEHSD